MTIANLGLFKKKEPKRKLKENRSFWKTKLLNDLIIIYQSSNTNCRILLQSVISNMKEKYFKIERIFKFWTGKKIIWIWKWWDYRLIMKLVKNTLYLVLFEADCLVKELYGKLSLKKSLRINIFPLLKLLKLAKQKKKRRYKVKT